jgi:hypothetical protein
LPDNTIFTWDRQSFGQQVKLNKYDYYLKKVGHPALTINPLPGYNESYTQLISNHNLYKQKRELDEKKNKNYVGLPGQYEFDPCISGSTGSLFRIFGPDGWLRRGIHSPGR